MTNLQNVSSTGILLSHFYFKKNFDENNKSAGTFFLALNNEYGVEIYARAFYIERSKTSLKEEVCQNVEKLENEILSGDMYPKKGNLVFSGVQKPFVCNLIDVIYEQENLNFIEKY